MCQDLIAKSNGAFTPEQDNDKTNVEPVHSYYAFHTRSDMSGVKGIIGMHRFNFCLVVVLSLSCSGVKTPLLSTTFFPTRNCTYPTIESTALVFVRPSAWIRETDLKHTF